MGLHQGSVLSPLLFIIVMDVISREIRGGLPWELLFADDLVLIAESEEELGQKVRNWKDAMEAKGLKVNVNKTKGMISGKCGKPAVGYVKYPCGVVCAARASETTRYYAEHVVSWYIKDVVVLRED